MVVKEEDYYNLIPDKHYPPCISHTRGWIMMASPTTTQLSIGIYRSGTNFSIDIYAIDVDE